jgi:hypothetical protein
LKNIEYVSALGLFKKLGQLGDVARYAPRLVLGLGTLAISVVRFLSSGLRIAGLVAIGKVIQSKRKISCEREKDERLTDYQG